MVKGKMFSARGDPVFKRSRMERRSLNIFKRRLLQNYTTIQLTSGCGIDEDQGGTSGQARKKTRELEQHVI